MSPIIVLEAASHVTGIPIGRLRSNSKMAEYIMARRLAVYVCRDFGLSFYEMSGAYGFASTSTTQGQYKQALVLAEQSGGENLFTRLAGDVRRKADELAASAAERTPNE